MPVLGGSANVHVLVNLESSVCVCVCAHTCVLSLTKLIYPPAKE